MGHIYWEDGYHYWEYMIHQWNTPSIYTFPTKWWCNVSGMYGVSHTVTWTLKMSQKWSLRELQFLLAWIIWTMYGSIARRYKLGFIELCEWYKNWGEMIGDIGTVLDFTIKLKLMEPNAISRLLSQCLLGYLLSTSCLVYNDKKWSV